MDFLKQPKLVQSCAIVWLLAIAIGFINNYFHVNSRNELRYEVLADSCSTNGVIADIYPPVYRRHASPGHGLYLFEAGGKKYYGHTFFMYTGRIYDTIIIFYQKKDPNKSIYIEDVKKEFMLHDVIYKSIINSSSLLILAIIVSGISFYWKRRKGRKRAG